MTEEKRGEIKELAKSMYAEGKGRDEFIVECKKYESEFMQEGAEMTDELAQSISSELSGIWSESLVEAENDKLGQVVSDVLSSLGSEKSVTHFGSREKLVEYLNPLTAKVIGILTDSGLKTDDVLKALDSALGKVKSVADEVVKSINIHGAKAFEKKVGKAQGELTLKEIADILKD